ncbi:TetR/AcrR family transcriptional regulator [Phaeobacter gallaeciensis]|jgi:AcrR family transcriptional regulator|uniref:TetR/AcrR family transcriptional regulator n=1 Tax=Phaeobacter gallaeciensis TaxID=60890 RepID=UPI00237F1D5E|nr:TetR/AcrR family transcriptional regulator [Phaeobacter gallaeciensis]MDE4305346.1 TetR/AcrR family transcriptional regulator [Phaeobacter gallaeciensis]MDE4309694.1 TetR/AcrR family transcriptional regulator [Phaeobacter gallaeciensis]MDE4313983.1 TetR/AcrR family transcriptional regulator [Phaeobacter gallaeciensis]MDE4318623.1 TetR/AcrR family transcriptional regulator [Phaeobacter gallaeciensis]MDE4322617.1 TetR/AcrR family transcriptional regulator [Phaeobacter gallaeciensis]
MLEQISASKSEILDAAAHCFMTMGADSASIDDIAASLGSTKGRIYHHFPSKGALLAAVQLRAARFTYQAVSAVADDALPPQLCLERMARAHVMEVLRSLPYHKVILQTYTGARAKTSNAFERGMQAQVRAEHRQYAELFRDQIARGIEADIFPERNLTVTVAGLMLMLNSPVFWYQPDRGAGQEFRNTIADDLAEMALASLRA